MFIKKGFTLIELLIVMAILGILATMGFGNFMQSRVKAKDIARKQDLQTIAKSLEAYANDKRGYPNTGTLVWGSAFSDTTVTPATIYASKLPTDPGGYSYYYEKSGSGYYLYAHLENTQDSALTTNPITPIAGCGGTEPSCNYRISSSNL
jgi:prepilin-type N-terminal cleavage/methylation domain-containing protein